MSSNRFLFLFVFAFALGQARLGQCQQEAHSLQLEASIEMDYLLYLPDSYDANRQDGFPLLLFLHGGGESGADVEKVKTHGPPHYINEGESYPFLVLSPLNPNVKGFWDEHNVMLLLDAIVQQYNVDRSRIYLAGMSRGAYAAWRLAAQHRDRFAALIAICGETPEHYAAWLTDLPIWGFHGLDDTVIPAKESKEMQDALLANGNAMKLTLYPDVDHHCWDHAFLTEGLWEWMLKQHN